MTTGDATLANQDVLSFSNYTTMVEEQNDRYLPNEKVIEGMILMLAGVLGILLNLLVLILTCSCAHLRIMMNGFTVHGCFLEIFKSGLCIPYALTLLNIKQPDYCTMLGTTYVIIQTAGLFNLLAMVLAEAYTFHVHNLNERDPDREGAIMCVLFGILMIYAGSVIVHLGPTLIGGHFIFNEDIGNCLFAYGQIKNYIVQAMWIGIVTLVFLILYRYIYKFYRLLKANEQFRITALARAAAAMSRGGVNNESIYDIVYRLKKKTKVLLAMSMISMVCWYPLFILTLIDVNYTRQRYLYRILTVIAWSHSALTPLPLLLIDRSFGVWYQAKRLLKEYKDAMDDDYSMSPEPMRKLLANNSVESTPFGTPKTYPEKQQMVTNYTSAGNRHILQTVTVSSPPSVAKNAMTNYGSVTNNGVAVNHSKNTNLLYDQLNEELHMIGTSLPSPLNMDDTVESRINQSRETDLIYDANSLLDYDLI